MTEILEIEELRTYRVKGLEIKGSVLIHKLADGFRYEELSAQMKEGVNNE